MKVARGRTYLLSELTVDEDIDLLTLYQVKRLANPASGEALRKGNKDIGNAEVSNTANIAESKLSLTQGTQAIYDKIGTDITAHGISSKHRWTADKLLLGAGVGSNPAEIIVPAVNLLVEDAQIYPATGTGSTPETMNDGSTAVAGYFSSTAHYLIIVFRHLSYISQYRFYKFSTSSTDNAVMKIEYWDELTGAWIDWKTGISVPNDANAWVNWDTSPSRVLTRKIRVKAVTMDSTTGRIQFNEIEFKD